MGAETTRCLDLLSHIGRDCVGALQLVPEGVPIDIRKITATPLSDGEILAVLQSYRTMPLGVNIEEEFRISVAGAQAKTAFLKHDNRWCRPSGTTPTSHIFKLPIGELGRYKPAKTTMPQCQAAKESRQFATSEADCKDGRVSASKRYDIRWIDAIPLESEVQGSRQRDSK